MKPILDGVGWLCGCLPKPVYWHWHRPLDPDESDSPLFECPACWESIASDGLDKGEKQCSRCAAADYREWLETKKRTDVSPNAGVKPPVCKCGFTLDKCTAGTCEGTDPRPGPTRELPRQGQLF